MAEFYGLTEDDVISRIEDGKTLTAISAECGRNRSLLTRWLGADEQRSARSVRARLLAAAAWDEQAEQEITDAADPFELAKAKEKAHHLRWRASKIAPREYGEKLETTHKGMIAVARELSEEELASIAAGSGG